MSAFKSLKSLIKIQFKTTIYTKLTKSNIYNIDTG